LDQIGLIYFNIPKPKTQDGLGGLLGSMLKGFLSDPSEGGETPTGAMSEGLDTLLTMEDVE